MQKQVNTKLSGKEHQALRLKMIQEGHKTQESAIREAINKWTGYDPEIVGDCIFVEQEGAK